MCLAIPARILSKKGNSAKVDFGGGTTKEIDISLVDAKVDEYVIVHAGFAIEVMDKNEAEETLRLWDELLAKE